MFGLEKTNNPGYSIGMKHFGKNIWCSSTLILLLFSSGFLHFCAHMANGGCPKDLGISHRQCSIECADTLPGMAVDDDCPFCAGLFSSLWLPEASEFDYRSEPVQEQPVTVSVSPVPVPHSTCARAPPAA